MKSLKQKRQQLAKQIRSKQRNNIFSSNRQKLYDSYEQQSLVTLIFLMIDKDQQEVSAESFDDFLEIISEEILGSQIEERKINDGISQAILQRYDSMLGEFLDKVNHALEEQRVGLIPKNRKQFDLVRFLIRLQVIQEKYLILLDSLLESASLRLNKLTKTLSNISLKNLNNHNNSHQTQLFSQLTTTLSIRQKLYKQVTYLYFLTRQQQQHSNIKQQNPPKLILKQTIKDMIVALTQKWVINNFFIEIFYSPQLLYAIKRSYQHQQRILYLFQQCKRFYLTFLLQHQEMLERIIHVNNGDFSFHSNKKIIEFLFIIFSLIQKHNNQPNEKDLGQQSNTPINEELILFTDLAMKIIKHLQNKISKCQIEKSNSKNKAIYEKLLKCLVDSFVESPTTKVFIRFLQQQQTQTNNNPQNRQNIIQSYCKLNKCNTNSNHQQKKQYQSLLIIKLLHSIQDLQYHDLVTFVQLLSIIISYNDTVIDILFKAKSFQGYYDQKLHFQIILEKKLLRHVSGEIRRRAVWMLSNVTGSEEFYYYGLGFIKSFYVGNVFQNEGFSQSEMTKQDALIKESLLQVIMNYLSNMRSYKEIQQLLSYNRDQNKQEEFFNHQSENYHNSLKQNDNKQPMLIWILRTLGSVVQNLANNTVIMKQTQKFIEVFIYSLYNLLTIQQNYKLQQNQQNNQHIVLSILQTYSIPKNLQTIYHNSQTTNQYSTFFTMVETLLDLINKVKNQN